MAISVQLFGQVRNKKKIEEFSYAVLGHFFDGRLKRDIIINMYFKKSVNDYLYYGLCDGDANSIDIHIAKEVKEYANSAVQPVPYDEIIRTVAHELVHAKQYIRRELDPYKEIWRKDGTVTDWTGMPEDESPWELEASYYEDILCELYWTNHGKVSTKQDTVYYW